MLKFYDKDKKEILFEDQRTYCKNPTCLGEPWCSAWGICKKTKTMEIDELFKELNENIVAEAVSNLLPPSSIPSQAQETPLHSVQTTARHISKSDREEEQAKESSRQFAPPKSDKEVEQARDSGKPTKTKQDTKYCVGLLVCGKRGWSTELK